MANLDVVMRTLLSPLLMSTPYDVLLSFPPLAVVMMLLLRLLLRLCYHVKIDVRRSRNRDVSEVCMSL